MQVTVDAVVYPGQTGTRVPLKHRAWRCHYKGMVRDTL